MHTVEHFAESQGLGPAEALLALEGDLPLPDGLHAPAHLLLTPHGVWLVAAITADRGRALALGRNPTLSYVQKLTGDRLEAEGLRFGLPRRDRGEVQRALRLGRLRARAREGVQPPTPEGPFFDEDPDFAALAGAWLEPGELLLAWLHTTPALPVANPIGSETEGDARFVLTDRRVVRLGLSPLGDLGVQALEMRPLEIEPLRARGDRVRVGSVEFVTTRANEGAFARLAPVVGLRGAERVRELAWRLRTEHPGLATRMLTALGAQASPSDAVLAAWLRGEDPGAALAGARAQEADPELLAEALVRWGADSASLRAWVGAGVDAAPEAAAWYLPLHRRAWAMCQDTALPSGDRAAMDLHLAEHLLLAGQPADAAALLDGALAQLPDESLSDLLPPEDADLVAGEAGPLHRVRLLECLAWARAEGGQPHPDTLLALARAQPLVVQRLSAALEQGPAPYRPRLEQVLAVMAHLHPTEAPAGGPVRPLSESQLQIGLRHPAAQPGGALEGLQGWLARQEPPRELRSYGERLSSKRSPDAVAAVNEATLMLSLPGLEAVLSHGDRSVGLRAFEGQPSVLLIGARHLDPEDPAWLRPAELRFAVGAELAHLRFGHTRVTRSELWEGTRDQLLSLAGDLSRLGVLGPLSRLAQPESLIRWVPSPFARTTLRLIGRGYSRQTTERLEGAARRWLGASADHGGSVGPRAAQLLAAHRVMSLTADRAGLLLAGDLASSLRAMLLTDPDLALELPLAEHSGVDAALSRRGPDRRMLHQDLAVRVAALVAFFLSDEYATLRQAIGR